MERDRSSGLTGTDLADQLRLGRWIVAVCVLLLLASFAIGARWPLVGDSVLMHYVVWLSQHGFAPYREIAEMNLPLTYMTERAAMTIFGAGSVGWRMYDGTLLVAMVLLCWQILRGRSAAAGVFAGTMFAAVHLQDGVHMAGQRDLLVTALEATAGLALLRSFAGVKDGNGAAAMPRVALWSTLAGALGMAAACIKPPAVLFVLAAVAWRQWPRPGQTSNGAGPGTRPRGSGGAVLGGAVAGALVPLLLCLLYLRHYRAVAAFLQDVHGLIAYHARLERRSPGFLIGHAWSPVLPFLLLTAAALRFARGRMPWSRAEILASIGVAAGLVSYVVQGKGFPYQRYPLLLWLLVLCASRTFAQLGQPGRVASQPGSLPNRRRWAAFVPLLTGLVLCAMFLARAARFSDADPYTALRNDLRAQDAAAWDGRVQCLDTAGPCIGALLKERLTQSTGFLYDCYLLDSSRPVVLEQRALLEREWAARPPGLIVMTDSNCFTGPRTFDKYMGWPWMQQQLRAYQIVLDRQPTQPLHLWSRLEQPYRYRILRRRN